MRQIIILMLLAWSTVGCTPGRVDREACYARQEASAIERVDRECPGAWEDCPARQRILEDLKREHAQCP